MPSTVIAPTRRKSAARTSWTSASWAVEPARCAVAPWPNDGAALASVVAGSADRRERRDGVGIVRRGDVEPGRRAVRRDERLDRLAEARGLVPADPDRHEDVVGAAGEDGRQAPKRRAARRRSASARRRASRALAVSARLRGEPRVRLRVEVDGKGLEGVGRGDGCVEGRALGEAAAAAVASVKAGRLRTSG